MVPSPQSGAPWGLAGEGARWRGERTSHGRGDSVLTVRAATSTGGCVKVASKVEHVKVYSMFGGKLQRASVV